MIAQATAEPTGSDLQRRIAADPVVAWYVQFLYAQIAARDRLLQQVQINHMAAQTQPPARSVN